MIHLIPDLRRPIVQPPNRDPLPFTPRPSPGDEFDRFEVMGTAHFTRRSIQEGIASAGSGRYDSIALELDIDRFRQLGDEPYTRSIHGSRSEGEFIAAADAFGNRNGDIWLIDWGMKEIHARISAAMTRTEARQWDCVSRQLVPYEVQGVRLWEAGRTDDAMRYLGTATDAMARFSPTVHRVLIDERNLVMAARLLAIADASPGRILVMVGKAHVDGIRRLLGSPDAVLEGLRRRDLKVTPAYRVRRTMVN